MTRCVWLGLLVCAGCHGALGNAPEPPPPESIPSQIATARGMPTTQPIASADPDEDAFEQAAAFLNHGDELAAVRELETYLSQHPEEVLLRLQIAEVYMRLHKLDQARLHLQLFIALAQEQGEKGVRYLIHAHSRLVDIAEQQDDAYEEQLNRGIGLYLLACKRDTERDADDGLPAEMLYFRAAGALRDARTIEPTQARTDLYLHHIWIRLGQRSSARRSLEAADVHAFASALTPRERRELHLAHLQIQQETRLLPCVSRISR